MQHSGLLAIPESDEEWEDFIKSFEEEGEDVYEYLKEDLLQMKNKLLQVLPERFHPYVNDGTINQPSLDSRVRKELLVWIEGKERLTEKVMEEAKEYLESIREQLPASLVNIVEEGLHDAQVQHIFRKDRCIRMTLNGDGSFSNASSIVIEMNDIVTETFDQPVTEGMYWLYEEADVSEHGFKLGVLFDSSNEWVVEMKDIQMTLFYRNESIFGFEGDCVATEKEIEEAENHLQTKLPKDYVSFLFTQNGGKPNHPFILMEDKELEIERFLSAEELVESNNCIVFAKCITGTLAFNKDHSIVYFENDGEIRTVSDQFDSLLDKMLSKEYLEEDVILRKHFLYES